MSLASEFLYPLLVELSKYIHMCLIRITRRVDLSLCLYVYLNVRILETTKARVLRFKMMILAIPL